MSFFVYKITNRVNGKAYIGCTEKTVQHRWKHHKYASRRDRSAGFSLYKAFNKYGTDSFSIEVVYEASSRAEMLAVERGLIASHGTFGKNGYNLTSGGEGVRDLIVSAETRKKIGDKRRGKKMTDEQRARVSAGLKEAFSTPEGRAKQSAKMKGRERSKAEKDLRAASIKIHWHKRRAKARAETNVIDLFPDEDAA